MQVKDLDLILEEEGRSRERLIPILHRIQSKYSFLPDECVGYVSEQLGIPRSTVYSVASFYEAFTFKRSGKYVIRLCDGTTCHSRGSGELIKAVFEKLNISKENNTTEDGLITIETVACLGACALAPSMEINGRVFTSQTLETITDFVEMIQMSQEELDE